MNTQELIKKIEKIFRANTVEVDVIIGQYDQTKKVKHIESIPELQQDIVDLVSEEYKRGKIDKKDIFIGTGKIGASYNVSEAIEIAKKWGFKYVAWNGGEILDLKGHRKNINYDEL